MLEFTKLINVKLHAKEVGGIVTAPPGYYFRTVTVFFSIIFGNRRVLELQVITAEFTQLRTSIVPRHLFRSRRVEGGPGITDKETLYIHVAASKKM